MASNSSCPIKQREAVIHRSIHVTAFLCHVQHRSTHRALFSSLSVERDLLPSTQRLPPWHIRARLLPSSSTLFLSLSAPPQKGKRERFIRLVIESMGTMITAALQHFLAFLTHELAVHLHTYTVCLATITFSHSILCDSRASHTPTLKWMCSTTSTAVVSFSLQSKDWHKRFKSSIAISPRLSALTVVAHEYTPCLSPSFLA